MPQQIDKSAPSGANNYLSSKPYRKGWHYNVDPYLDTDTEVALDEHNREFKVFAERKDDFG
jgi:hypothetical protein